MIWLYTDKESGVWLPWPAGSTRFIPTDEALAKKVLTEHSYVYGGPNGGNYRTAIIHGVALHSFQTFLGTQWDVVNGWRKEHNETVANFGREASPPRGGSS